MADSHRAHWRVLLAAHLHIRPKPENTAQRLRGRDRLFQVLRCQLEERVATAAHHPGAFAGALKAGAQSLGKNAEAAQILQVRVHRNVGTSCTTSAVCHVSQHRNPKRFQLRVRRQNLHCFADVNRMVLQLCNMASAKLLGSGRAATSASPDLQMP